MRAEVPAPVASGDAAVIEVRDAGAADFGFLASMLVEAIAWRPDAVVRDVDDVLATPEFGHYLLGWPRPDDRGVVAVEGGVRVGAAWYRVFAPPDTGFGFAGVDIPEVTIAVVRGHRGRGVGRTLLDVLVAAARSEGRRALSLSVEPDNFARRLYEAVGFRVVDGSGGALTMLGDLGPH